MNVCLSDDRYRSSGQVRPVVSFLQPFRDLLNTPLPEAYLVILAPPLPFAQFWLPLRTRVRP